MGYKVTNKNAIIGKNTSTITDTVFFFSTLEQAEEYYDMVCNSTFNTEESEHILEVMTEEEEEKFSFQIPLSYQIPHKMIVRPLVVPQNEPYWVETKELLMPAGMEGEQ